MPSNSRTKTAQYRGPKRFVEYPEAQGRIVERLRFWHSPSDGQAVTVHFADGMRIHIAIEALLRVETEVAAIKNGDLRTTKTYRPVLGAPIP
jgi:hypothetical protein